ncbi:hypothetical protein [Rhizobium grahamii]|uniref:Uncharacterized protein n=1 Tax=Rhizobium grahamii CCGE 502 TaxID=990285 RepID=S3HUX4_9HYPH|nr:hypothetical protein [Rhizobium grahamii]EPE96991.1 hypothetical protein RGCCGE502_17510 [Rhizobium grahamii CCGE 502]
MGCQHQGAEAKLRILSGRLQQTLTTTTLEAAREITSSGYSRGAGPASIARDLVGRSSKVTGKREGGVVGLNDPLTELVERTRINLLSGNPALMKNYLALKTRDKRLDGAVKRAIAAGKPLDADTLDKVLMRRPKLLFGVALTEFDALGE